MNKKFNPRKPTRTNAGDPVRILDTDFRHKHYSIIGVFCDKPDDPEEESVQTWTKGGLFNYEEPDSVLNLENYDPATAG